MKLSRYQAQTLMVLVVCLNEVMGQSLVLGPDIKLATWKFEELQVFIEVLLLLICTCLFKMFYPRIPYVHEYLPQSIILILVGVAFGAVLKLGCGKVLEDTIWLLTPGLFFNCLLPPIVLDAAFNLYNRTFISFLGSILVYAVLGTILNFLIIGPLMFGLHRCGVMGAGLPDIPINAYFLFASLIVAVDPVAVLAIFQEIGVDLGLYYTVFGESLFNDAVTVVLYEIMKEFIQVKSVTPAEIGLGFGSFFTISIGGLLIGFIFGIIASILTRVKSHFECIIVLLLPYFAYILTDCIGWSGIIAMIGCGLVEAAYAFQNIAEKSQSTVRGIVTQSSEISEGIIFFLIGIQLFSADVAWHTGFCLWGLVACLLARTIVVLSLSALLNYFKVNQMQIRYREQAILIYGGLRGAVSFSLAFLVERDRLGASGANVKKMIVTGTLFIILATVGLMGLTIKPLVRLFHVQLAGKKQLSIFMDTFDHVLDHTLAGVESTLGVRGRNRFREWLTHIDDKFIRRLLQRDPEIYDEQIVKTYEKVALQLHFATINPEASESYLQDLPVCLRKQHEKEVPTTPPPRYIRSDSAESDELQEEENDAGININPPRSENVWIQRTSTASPYNVEENYSKMYMNILRRKSNQIQKRHRESIAMNQPALGQQIWRTD